jgi:hypothetical protein
MNNFPALTVADCRITSTRPLIRAILQQADGPRRYESRVLSAVAHAIFAADALASGGAGYLTDADADEARSWVRLEIGGVLPRLLETGTLWLAEALLRLESEYEPGACGGYESTRRTVVCSFAARRQAGAGGHWNAAIAEAADRVRRMSREAGEAPGSGEVGLIAYAYAGHLARLTVVAATRRGEQDDSGVLLPYLDLAAEVQITAIEITATAALQWLRRQVVLAAKGDVADDLADAFDDLGRAIVGVHAETGRDGRRFDRQVGRIVGAL